MKIEDKQIEKFQDLYKKHFGEEISKEDALDRGARLVRLIEEISKSTGKEGHQDTRK